MREAFCQALIERSARHELVFLTGDLGFRALEPLRDRLGPRFLNCGVAEQNMVGVAAGLAREGLEVWVYSIASFCVARPFEQIRNDLALHALPVRLVGNGGGYAYGVMGPTHHALEDYGILLTLPHTSVFVPAFDLDVEPIVERMAHVAGPSYLRLGREERAAEPGWTFAPWRCLRRGDGPIVVACGPIVGSVVQALMEHTTEGEPAEVWVTSELHSTGTHVPAALEARLGAGSGWLVVEEHREQGGIGARLAHWALTKGLQPGPFRHLCAQGYPSRRYGSQRFHRLESGLDPDAIRRAVAELTNLTRRTDVR